MAFGKRPNASQTTMTRMPRTDAGMSQRDRWEKLRDQMLALLDTAHRVADAVSGEGSLSMPVIAGEPEATAGPFELKGFHEHFVKANRSGFTHLIFAYTHPSSGEGVDPNAQYHLQQLTGQALAFNLYCQRAELDEALIVALQSPDVPQVIDALLVRSAFFAAYFDNMLAAMPDEAGEALARNAGWHKANLTRHLLRAQDKMLAPENLEKLTPLKGWPFVGVELDIAPHDGDYFINGVYFPAEHARLLLAGNANAKPELHAVA